MQLAEYLDSRDLTAKAFARSVGVDASMVTRWRNRKTLPGPKNLRAIAEVTGGLVTANDFVAAPLEPTPEPAGAA